MSADGDIVRDGLNAIPWMADTIPRKRAALAALARLEAAAEEAHFQGEITKALMPYQERAVEAEAQRDALAEALRRASGRLGDLTQPPWVELTPLVAEVRDDVRAALDKFEGIA